MTWQAGAQLLQQGKTAEAIEVLQQATLAQPQSFESHFYLGLAYGQAGKLPQAEGELRQAVGLSPSNALAFYNLGLCFQVQGKGPEAIQAFQETLRLDPHHAKAAQALAKLTGRQVPPAAAAPPPTAPSVPARTPGVECRHCGMESREGDACEFCGKPLIAPRPSQERSMVPPVRAKAGSVPTARTGMPTAVKVSGAIVVLAALAGGVYFFAFPRGGGAAANLNPYANGAVRVSGKAELENLYKSVNRSNPDQVIRNMQQALKKDPKNANLYFLMSFACAEKGQTSDALSYLKQGNQQKACYVYVTETGLARMMMVRPHYYCFRQLARDLTAAAFSMGPKAGAEALKEGRKMGYKIAEEQPRTMIAVLVAGAIAAIVDKALVQLDPQAYSLQAADLKWLNDAKARFKPFLQETSRKSADRMKKMGLDMNNPNFDVKSLPLRKRRSLDRLLDEMSVEEARLVEEILKTRPL